MVVPSEPDRADTADSADERNPATPEESPDSDTLVPDKQIHRWKDDGGPVSPDS